MSTEKKDVTLDHPRIWLQNADDAEASGEGRLWCEDNVWSDNQGDGEPTEYVRADIFEKMKRIAEHLAELHASELKRTFPEIYAALSSYRKQGE